MAHLSSADADRIEALIDRHGVRALLETVADICRLKGHHIREAWQDDALANRWIRAAEAIERAESSAALKRLAEIEGR